MKLIIEANLAPDKIKGITRALYLMAGELNKAGLSAQAQFLYGQIIDIEVTQDKELASDVVYLADLYLEDFLEMYAITDPITGMFQIVKGE